MQTNNNTLYYLGGALIRYAFTGGPSSFRFILLQNHWNQPVDKEILLETKTGNNITSIPQSTFDQVR